MILKTTNEITIYSYSETKTHKSHKQKILVATTVDSHAAILSIAKKILESTAAKIKTSN